jgi:flagellar motor switch protein FliM
VADDDFDSGLSDILSQDDIDSLLSQAQQGDEPAAADSRHKSAIIMADGSRLGDDEQVFIEPYDFRNPSFLGETQMRRLRLMHEDFIRLFEARASLFLRTEVSITMSKLETLNYDNAIQSIENPTHLALFRASPLPGVGFMEINPRLALTAASSILGGKGQAPKNDRYLTRIEVDLIEEFLFIMLQEWCDQWQYEERLEPTIVGHEVVGSVLQICEHDTVMLCLTVEVGLRGCSGRIQLAVPLFTIEPLVKHIQAKRDADTGPRQPKGKATWRKGFASVPVRMQATMPVGRLTVGEVLGWKVGDTIALPENCMDKVQLRLAKVPVFSCQLGVENDNMAVSIQGKYQSAEEGT